MKEFFENFWSAASGFYCIGEKTKKGMVHRYYQSIDEVIVDIYASLERPNNIYFSPAVFSQAERNQKNVKSVKAFWLDIDCAGEHNGRDYQSREEGLQALDDFVKKTGLPLPTLVNSGRGIHAYWVLKDPLDPKTWKQYALSLKQLCVLHGLKADPSRTADSASLMRPINTINYKAGNTFPVERIRQVKEYDLDELQAIKPKVIHEILGEEVGILEPEYPEASAERVIERCPVIRDIANKRGAVEEPLWRGFLSVLFRCQNGANLVHEYSKGDPRYSYKETQAKAEGTAGPYTCSQFQGLCPDTCNGCPFRGRVTSPIVLGNSPTGYQPSIPADTEGGSATANVTDRARVSDRICSVQGFVVTEKGILRETNDRSFYITTIPIWVKSVREKATQGLESAESSLRIEWEDLTGRLRVGVITQADIYESRAFTRWLADNNIRACVKGKEAITLLQEYITRAIQEIMRSKTVERYYGTLGWHPDGFVLGDRLVSKSGVTPASVEVNSSCGRLRPIGNKEEWVKATSVYKNPKLWPGAFAILCGFASPLLALCKFQGAVVSLFGASGYGKTLAGSMALSIYGDPTYLTQAASTTVNAIGVQLSAQKNLPYLLDEVSSIPAYKLADFIYDAVNGRPKESLTQDRVMRQENGWCLVPFVTSNHSVLEMSTQFIQDAHRRRLVEIPFEYCIDGEDAAKVANAYQDHCGTVGPEFLQYVVRHSDRIVTLVENFLKHPTMTKIPSTSRFGKWTIACAGVAGTIARSLGLIEFDPQPVINSAIDTYYRSVTEVSDDAEIAKSALVSFLLDNAFGVNVWSSSVKEASLTAVRQVFARFDPATETYYIQAKLYETTLRNAGLSVKGMARWQESVGIRKGYNALACGFPVTICYVVPKDALGAGVDTVLEKINSGKDEA